MNPSPAAERRVSFFFFFASPAISFISCQAARREKIRSGRLFSAQSLCKCAIGNFFSLTIAKWNLFSLQLHETIKKRPCVLTC